MDAFVYPVHIDVKYANDKEYRACVRQLFGMRESAWASEDEEGVDEVSRDEADYDDDVADAFVAKLARALASCEEIQELCVLAAGAMLSQDADVGLVVLMSYDTLSVFHALLARHFANPDASLETDPDFVFLTARFTRAR
jgi:hypothetical protein